MFGQCADGNEVDTGCRDCPEGFGGFDTAGCLADGLRAAREALDTLGLTVPEGSVPMASGESGSGKALWLVEAVEKAGGSLNTAAAAAE